MHKKTILTVLVICLFCATHATTQDKDRPVIALALQGGGARGLAHAGVIQVLEELGVPVDIVVGNSMGAIIGGFYAIGYTSEDINELILTMDWPSLFTEPASLQESSYTERCNRARYAVRIPFSRDGLALGSGVLDGNHALAHLDRLTIRAPSPIHFDNLPRRFRAVASDIITGEAVVLDSGSLADAIRASMSIPGVFKPHVIDGRYLVDGLILDNLPIDVARSLGADIIIAVYLEDHEPVTPERLEKNPVEILERTLEIFTEQNVLRQLPNADIVIPVDITALSVNDFLKADEFIARGKAAAYSMQDRLAALAIQPKIPATPSDPVNLMDSLSIIGGTPADHTLIRDTLESGRGIRTDKKTLEALYHALVQKNRYSRIRMQHMVRDGHRELVVRLTDKKNPGHAIHAGFLHEGTYYSDMATHTSISAGATFRNITVPSSYLSLTGGFNGALFTEASYRHPLSDRVSIEPFFLWKQQSGSTFYDTDSRTYMETVWIQTGASLRYDIFSGSEVYIGWNRAWIDTDPPPGMSSADNDMTVSLFEAGFRTTKLDSCIFPMKGFALDLSYILSAPVLGSDAFFQVLTISGTAIVFSPEPYSLAVHWYGGSDFSGSARISNTAQPFLSPALTSRHLFPGPVPLSLRVGNTVLATGLEAKRKWAVASAFFSLPVFALSTVSAGFVSRDFMDFQDLEDSILVCITAGIGTRINEGFGISLKGGVMLHAQEEPAPFLAVDIGSTIH